MLRASGNPPPSRHRRKKANERPTPGHERCQHMWRLVREQPTFVLNGTNSYHFGCYCLVTRRWMRMKTPLFYFWFGTLEDGRPTVEYGEFEAGEEITLHEVQVQDPPVQTPEAGAP